LLGNTAWISGKSRVNNDAYEASKLMKQLDERVPHFLTDDLLMLMGDDFRYMNAAQNYDSIDNMIAYMNKHHSDKYILRYSTPSDYVDALHKHNVTWPVKYDDMFPYADGYD